MVDFKAKLVEGEWKKLGKQIVALADECTYKESDKWVCVLCNRESPIGVEGEKPLFAFHDEDCEIGKSLELIHKIRKRLKGGKK